MWTVNLTETWTKCQAYVFKKNSTQPFCFCCALPLHRSGSTGVSSVMFVPKYKCKKKKKNNYTSIPVDHHKLIALILTNCQSEKTFFFWPGHRDQVRGLSRSSARTFEGLFSDVVSKQWLQDTQWFKWAWAGSSSLFLESLQTDTREGGWTQVKELCWRQFISLII